MAPSHRASALVLAACSMLGCGADVRIHDIHDIQGAGHTSPLDGREVQGVSGIVTALDGGDRDPGFWIEDPEGDDDDATSEGIFVATPELVTDIAIGDAVTVDGRVEETADPRREHDLTRTRLLARQIRPATVERDLPPPVRLGRGGRPVPSVLIDDDALQSFEPATDGIDFFESLEGMRVVAHEAVVVGPRTRFGEIVVVADGGADAGPRSRRGGLVMSNDDDPNPERLMVSPRLLGRMPDIDVGDRLRQPLVGVVDYGFGNFKILPMRLGGIDAAPTSDETTELSPGKNHLTLATFNVFNLSTMDDAARIESLAQVLVRNLAMPDVVALQEVQDDNGPQDDGTTSAAETFQVLIDAVESAGGPSYDFAQVDPADGADGGQPGANIRVGLLFNPARVELVRRGEPGPQTAAVIELEPAEPGGPRLRVSPTRLAPGDPAFEGSRKPLVAEILFRGHKLFVIVTHLGSKRDDDPLMGRRQPPRRPSEAKRTAQALVLRAFLDTIAALDDQAGAILLGDMNEMEYRGPFKAMQGTGWVQLTERLDPDDRYTFNYNGNSQALDHVLVSPALAASHAPEIDVVHVHADRAYGRRPSDHDPVLIRLSFGQAGVKPPPKTTTEQAP